MSFQPGQFVTHKLSKEKMLVLPVPISGSAAPSTQPDLITYVRRTSAPGPDGYMITSKEFHDWFYTCELEKEGKL